MRVRKNFVFDAKEITSAIETIEKNVVAREAATKAAAVDGMQKAKEGNVAEFQKFLKEYQANELHLSQLDSNAAGYLVKVIQYLGNEHLSPIALASIVKGAGDVNVIAQRANKTLTQKRKEAKEAAAKKAAK